MTTTSSRLLDLLSLLQARRDWPGSELAERLEVSGRTVRRDVERLRALGYPVESLTGPAGGYRLRAGTAMPPLLLDEEEAIAIAVGLRTAARASVTGIEETAIRALVKLEQVLPAHLRRRVAALGSSMVASPPGGPTVDPQQLTTIAAACRDHECLRFGYSSRDKTVSRRDVEPHALVNLGRRWYLAAWDRGREDWRTFRVDRIERPAPTGARFTARPLPAGDAAAYVEQSIAGAFSRYEARVTVHAAAEELVARLPHLAGALTPIDARRCEYRATEENLEWLALRIAMLGADVEVHEPPELVEQMRALERRLRRATRAYRWPMSTGACDNEKVSREDGRELRVRDVMVRRPKTLPADATVADLRRMFANGHVTTALLVDGARFAGAVQREDMPEAASPDAAPAIELARRDVDTIEPDAPVAAALAQLDEGEERRLVVLDPDGETLRGLLCLTTDRSGFCQSDPK